MPYQQQYNPRGMRGPRYNPHEDVSSNPNHEQFRKLFIGGLSYETDEKSLKAHFEQWGEIVDVIVMKDGQTKRSRGFGFITYKEASQLDEAQKNRPHKVDGREVESKRAMPRDDPMNQQSVKKMFVGGLKDDTTEEQIRDCFSGTIEQVELIKDKLTGKSRGFCFVTFDDTDTVDKHVLKKHFELNNRKVEVKKAFSKNEVQFHPGGGPRDNFYNQPYPMGGAYNQRGPYGGGNYGYSNQGYGYDYHGGGSYGNQGGWGGGQGNYNYGGPGYMKGGHGGGNYGGGSNYNRR